MIFDAESPALVSFIDPVTSSTIITSVLAIPTCAAHLTDSATSCWPNSRISVVGTLTRASPVSEKLLSSVSSNSRPTVPYWPSRKFRLKNFAPISATMSGTSPLTATSVPSFLRAARTPASQACWSRLCERYERPMSIAPPVIASNGTSAAAIIASALPRVSRRSANASPRRVRRRRWRIIPGSGSFGSWLLPLAGQLIQLANERG